MAVEGSFRLGIDFGTSNTVAILRRRDGSATPLLFDSSPLLASAVFAGLDAQLLTGADADRAAAANPAGLEANPKRRVDDGTIWLGEHELPVVGVIAAVLARVADEARRVAGQEPSDVVLTHPATWSRTRLGILAAAAGEAGLARGGTVDFVPEPVAAAAYFAAVLDHDLRPGQGLVVYDLGAGTFDVTVLRRTPAGFEMAATDGLADVGGLDLDAVVVDHARELTRAAQAEWARLDWPATPVDQRVRRELWLSARASKEQLSRHATTGVYVPLVEAALHLTRAEFEAAARPHLDRTVALTLATLRDAGVSRERLAGIFLVGGSSRIPLAASLLHRALRIAPTVLDQPELVVAEGSLHTDTTARTSFAVPPAASTTLRLPAGRSFTLSAPPTHPPAPAPDNATDPTPAATPTPPPAPPPAPTADQTTDQTTPPTAAPTAATTGAPTAPTTAAPTAAGTTEAATPGPAPSGATEAGPGETSPAPAAAEAEASPAGTVEGLTGPTASSEPAALATPTALAAPTAPTAVNEPTAPTTASEPTVLAAASEPTTTSQPVDLAPTAVSEPTALGAPTAPAAVSEPIAPTALTEPAAPTALTEPAAPARPTGGPPPAGGGGRRRVLAVVGAFVVVLVVVSVTVWLGVRDDDPDRGAAGSSSSGAPASVSAAASTAVIGVPYSPPTVTAGATLAGHTGFVTRIAFSPDGRLLATASYDKTVRLWDVTTGQTVMTLREHSKEVVNVAFNPKGGTIATASWDKTARIWDLATGRTLKVLNLVDQAEGLAFSPDGATLATSSWPKGVDGKDYTNTVRLWDVATGTAKRSLPGLTDHVHSLAFNADGTVLVTADYDDTVRLWDVATGTNTETLSGHTGDVVRLAVSKDGNRVVSASEDQTARIWYISTARPAVGPVVLQGHAGAVNAATFSPDGRTVVTVGNDATVRLWNAETGAAVQTLKGGHTDAVESVVFSPDGKLLATGSVDHTARLWTVVP